MTWLRRLAARMVRGPQADLIRADLEELYARDRAREIPALRAHLRFVRRLLASTISIASNTWSRPRVPRFGWLDIKLAFRLLRRNAGISLVAGLALAIGIPIGLAPIHLTLALNPRLPYPNAHDIVGVDYINADSGNDLPLTMYDVARVRREVTSFATFGAARRLRENLAGADGVIDVRSGAEVTASAFDIPRVPPLLGRTLMPADEDSAATPVVVIGHDIWQSQFHGAQDILSKSLRVGATRRAIVGVMPKGFEFPHRGDFWIPIQITLDAPPASGPRYAGFARLRDGASRAGATAEFEAWRQRVAAEHPAQYAKLRAEITEFAFVTTNLRPSFGRVYVVYVASLLLLGLACANVGTLMLARTASRRSEIAVRTALGASRARIVLQLFTEALVLSALAAAIGLGAAEIALRQLTIVQLFEASLPPWFTLRLTAFSIAVAAGLVLFSAVIAGLLPALKATGKRTALALQRGGAGGATFGWTTSLLIVVEVATAVVCLAGVGAVAKGAFRAPSLGATTAAAENLVTELYLPPEARTGTSADLPKLIERIQREAERRLLAEPGVRAVSFASHLPGMRHLQRRIEVEGRELPRGAEVLWMAFIDQAFLDALGQRVLAGRNFEPRDAVAKGRPVLVNRSFVDRQLGGTPALGTRVRLATASDETADSWHEVIGIVDDLGMNVIDPANAAGVYNLIVPGQLHPAQLLVRVAGDPEAFVPRLRGILNEIEPAIVLDQPVRLDRVFSEELWEARFSALTFTAVAIAAVVLSAAALYALMAFAVTQRTREIAIRSALGARPLNIVRIVIARALVQLAAGVALGAAIGAALVPEILGGMSLAQNWTTMLAAVSAAMCAIGLLACAAPTRRALRIQPVQALKES